MARGGGGGNMAPPPPSPTMFLSCCTTAVCCMACLHNMVSRLMINAAGCGCRCSHLGGCSPAGPGGPPHGGVARGLPGGVAPEGGAGFVALPLLPSCQAEYARVHRQPDAGSHGPGPAPVRVVACQPPAPRGCDGRAVVAGPPPQACCRGHGRSILLGHSVGPRGVRYPDHLEGLVRLAHKLVGVVRCGVWVVIVTNCVVINDIHLPQCHQCYTVLAGREKQQVTFVVDSL
jgi:hypothetical protein